MATETPGVPGTDVDSGAPFALRASARALARAQLGALVSLLAVGWYRFGATYVSIVFAIGLVFWAVFPDRRIEVDAEGLTFVPRVPLRPRQHLPFAALGRFAIREPARWRSNAYRGVRAPIVDPRSGYRMGGVFPVSFVELAPFWTLRQDEPALQPEELVDLLNAHWAAALTRQGLIVPP